MALRASQTHLARSADPYIAATMPHPTAGPTRRPKWQYSERRYKGGARERGRGRRGREGVHEGKGESSCSNSNSSGGRSNIWRGRRGRRVC